jgi:hypothetical protein
VESDMATKNPKGIRPFREFVKSLGTAKHVDFKALPHAKVANPDAFEEMKKYLRDYNEDVTVEHSFVDENGQIFDCVPIRQQASLKNVRYAKIAKPVDLPKFAGQVRSEGAEVKTRSSAQASQAPNDKFGNQKKCPEGTVPVRRVTLEELSRFETLRHFFRKSPGGKHYLPPSPPPATDPTQGHRYATAYQSVNNLGGHSFLNVCTPTTASGQMSLSQHWYSAGTGNSTQTAEAGWQVMPATYNTTKPVLFIYWTADNYQTTGCYNLCGKFVLVGSAALIGGAITGTEIELAWYLYQGNWWLYYGGTGASDAVGYFPTSIYSGGGMASNATQIQYGGETYGTTSWPQMGTGQLASAGLNKAAYQRNIFYFPTNGAPQLPTLTPYQPTTACYTIAVFP